MAKKKRKLTSKEKKLASQYIAEEIETGKYPRKQAIAIGISRAREQTKKTIRENEISRIMSRYSHG